jgi:carboxyl-terminal processing protease
MRRYSRPGLRTFFTAFGVGVIFTAGFGIGTVSSVIRAQDDKAPENFGPLWEAYDLIQRDYIDDIPDDVLVQGALDGMIDALDDPFSDYMSPDDYAAVRDSLNGEVQGIGVVIRTDEETGEIEVVGVLDGTPAKRAGILPGDILYAVDGVLSSELEQGELANMVRGEEGTSLVVSVRRGDQTIDFQMVRERITIPNVEAEVLEGNIAYVRLNQFTAESREQLDATFNSINVNARKGLIFDLRDNPGGLLSSAIDIASAFIPDGIILTEAFSDENQQVYQATGDTAGIRVPVVVLVNAGSASASELVSGALQDRGVATLVGTTTFGKGTVQTWQDLSNGGGLRLTIARWLTPNGNWIHEVGITPDIIVEWTPESYEDPDDPQLERAVDLILSGEARETLPADLADRAA